MNLENTKFPLKFLFKGKRHFTVAIVATIFLLKCSKVIAKTDLFIYNIKYRSLERQMSGSDENYSKHHEKEQKRRKSNPDLHGECKKKHKDHKRRKSNDSHDDHKTWKIKEESKTLIRVKSESKSRHQRKHIKTEAKEENLIPKSNRLAPSGSKIKSRDDCNDTNGNEESNAWGESTNREKPTKSKGEVQKPNFGLSGKLTEDTNVFNGVIIKYSEPPEARMPKKRWRLYPFKGDQGLPTLYIHRQSAYLLGRDRKVADIPIDHPSCSKQHAALQYRLVTYRRTDGTLGKQIRLYIIDLESANGTYINNNKIESKKYVELFEKDVIKFGFSSREYVLLHEHSKDDNESENES